MSGHVPIGRGTRSRSAGGLVGPTRLRRVVAGLAGVMVVAAAVGAATPAAPPRTVTPPDMQIKVPTNLISIGLDPNNDHRMLRFTHQTWDAGTGPFEIDPSYDSTTGIATFVQRIYNSPSPGVWAFDHTAPVAATGVRVPPDDYNFPLTSFTLNSVNPDGSTGGTLATSPKSDYCITGDVRLGGVPNTPNQTFIPASNCVDPTKPLGWSVGWADQYDQTDAGQPIDLTGVADGTYVLRGTVDPRHVLTESDPYNNAVDTKLQVTGNSVTVLSQSNPGTTPPAVAMTSPAAGSTVSGSVPVAATASATAPATVASVQFLLDGQSLRHPCDGGAVHLQLDGGQHSPGQSHPVRPGDGLGRQHRYCRGGARHGGGVQQRRHYGRAVRNQDRAQHGHHGAVLDDGQR